MKSWQWSWVVIVASWFALLSSWSFEFISAGRTYDAKRISELREEVRSVFYHGYDSYIKYAYPYDELRPLSCDGVDTWGSYSLTLIDTLDTLAVMGNYSEFRRVAQLIIDNAHFDLNINVSVFETNIRIIGGLLSAHLLSHKAGMEVDVGWPCTGPLLKLAETVARKLLPAFDTPTGMPYGTVNLRYGVPPSETPVTCTAGVGTFIVEFGALSRLTGDPVYERVALKAMHSLYARRSALDLVGNHIDTQSGKWTAVDSGIGAGVDSYFEYLVKGAILFQRPELMQMFRVFYAAIEKHLGKGGWYVWATMGQGHVSATTFQSLETFFPGMLSLIGEFKTGLKAITNYHRILKQYGGLPELYNIVQGKATYQREGYPLRPELIESAMYLYRATEDPYLLEIGEDILHAIEYSARTECGYATIKDVTTLTLEDRMESFFLAETVKYLYLLFDPDNFIHSQGEDYTVIDHPLGKCTVYSGGYIFNTEAHPIDPAALNCCTGVHESELHEEIQVIDEIRSAARYTGRKKPKRAKPKKSKKPLEANKTETQKSQNTDTGAAERVSSIVQHNETPNDDIPLLLPTQHDLFPSSSMMILPPKSHRSNPLLDFKFKPLNITPVLYSKINIDMSEILAKSMAQIQAATDTDDESVVMRLLRKLFEEQKEIKEKFEYLQGDDSSSDIKLDKTRNSFASGISKGLKFSSASDEAKDLQKLVESFETNLKDKQSSLKLELDKNIKPVKAQSLSDPDSSVISSTENRIVDSKKNGEKSPDLDLIFGTSGNSRSLSYYFSFKWMRNFPDLIRQLIPSEKFDIQSFYSKMNTEFTEERFSKQYNISKEWMRNHAVLGCPNIQLADRFMFFRSSIDE